MAKTLRAPKHQVHKYIRLEPKHEGSSPTYRCVLPGCKHWLREEFMIGQVAICHGCEEEFEVTKAIFYPRKVKRVHCTKSSCKRATYNKSTGRVEKKVIDQLPDEIVAETLDDIISGRLR